MLATASSDTAVETSRARTVDLKLEVVVIPVADVDRAKRFDRSLGWRLDADIAAQAAVGAGAADEQGPRAALGDVADSCAQCAAHLEADPIAARASETEDGQGPASRTRWVSDMGGSPYVR